MSEQVKTVSLCAWCWDCDALSRRPEFKGYVISETICDECIRKQTELGNITLSLLEPLDLME